MNRKARQYNPQAPAPSPRRRRIPPRLGIAPTPQACSTSPPTACSATSAAGAEPTSACTPGKHTASPLAPTANVTDFAAPRDSSPPTSTRRCRPAQQSASLQPWSRPEILNAPPQSGSPRSVLSAQKPQPTATAAWPSSHEPPAKAPWSSATSAKPRSVHSEPPPADASAHDPAPPNTTVVSRSNADASSRPGPHATGHSMHIRCNPSKRKAPDRHFRRSGAFFNGGRYWV